MSSQAVEGEQDREGHVNRVSFNFSKHVPFSADTKENQGSKQWHPSPSIKLPLLPEHDTDRLMLIRWRPCFPWCSSPGFSDIVADLHQNQAQEQLKGFTSRRCVPSSGYSVHLLRVSKRLCSLALFCQWPDQTATLYIAPWTYTALYKYTLLHLIVTSIQ